LDFYAAVRGNEQSIGPLSVKLLKYNCTWPGLLKIEKES